MNLAVANATLFFNLVCTLIALIFVKQFHQAVNYTISLFQKKEIIIK